MKVLLLAYLSLSEVFFVWSEMELSFGYSDVVRVPNRSQPAAQVGFFLELECLESGASEAEVTARLDEADAQLRRYLADPELAAVAPPQRLEGCERGLRRYRGVLAPRARGRGAEPRRIVRFRLSGEQGSCACSRAVYVM